MAIMVNKKRVAKLRNYLLAVIAVAIAVILGLAVQYLVGVAAPFIAFYPAVILVVLIGDVGPALFAITLSVLSATFLFLEPIGSIRISAPGDIAATVIFSFSGVLLTIIAHRLRTARAAEALRKAHGELELRVEERTAELQEAYETLKAEAEERRQLEEQLIQSQKMEAIGTLAGGIAHDFNNILAAMLGFTEMVLDDVSDNPHAREKMERVLKAGLRGRDLVRQILAFSRKSEGEREEIRLTSLVTETHGLLRSSLPSTIRMPLAITANDDYVLADQTQLQQVLMNLATNGAHAMREEGGDLTIGLSLATFSHGSSLPDPDLKPGTYVKLMVKDTGTGITRDVRQRIFEPFFTTKAPGQGTGMGLAVVYGIVKSHGGAVTVQSEVGRGSTFEVYLPRAKKPEARKEEATTLELPAGTEWILFVDDEELLVEVAQGILESLGYRVTVAKHGSQAWNLFLEDPFRFDLVITDQTMPDVTGLSLARRMLSLRKDTPIIICTGYNETISADTAKEAGIRAFVMKPILRKELAETIRRVLDGNKAGGNLPSRLLL
ncbi:MAG TPA: ATP-binding protein [Syntrophorhabdales bacterium]|nr:ATP-binding protein [Syntrophorhabdales bacterium]